MNLSCQCHEPITYYSNSSVTYLSHTLPTTVSWIYHVSVMNLSHTIATAVSHTCHIPYQQQCHEPITYYNTSNVMTLSLYVPKINHPRIWTVISSGNKWSSRCHRILWDLIGHSEWHHLAKKIYSKLLIKKETFNSYSMFLVMIPNCQTPA